MTSFGTKLRTIYVCALACIGLVTIGSYLVIKPIEQSLTVDALLVGAAERQAIVNRRIASRANLLRQHLADEDAASAQTTMRELDELVALSRTVHETLVSHDAARGPVAPELRESLAQAAEDRADIADRTGSLLNLVADGTFAGQPAAFDAPIASMVARATALEQRMARIAELFDNGRERKLEWLRTLEGWRVALVLATLLLLAAFGFEPAIRRLIEQEQRLLTLQATIDEHTSYSVTDTDGRILAVNEAFCRLSGYTEDELIGQSHRIMNSGHHTAEFWRGMWATIAGGQAWHGDVCNRRKDGTPYWVRTTNIPRFDRSGRICSYFSLRFDITDQKAAENALHKAHRSLADLLDAASQFSVIATDPEGLITTFNKGAERMLGYTAEEMIGKQTPAVIHLDSEIAERSRELSAKFGEPIQGFNVLVWLARLGAHEEREWTYVRKSGRRVPVKLTVTAVRDGDGRLTGFLGVARDVSARKVAEAKLEAQQAEQRAILDAIPATIFFKDHTGKVLDCNFAATEKLGRPRENIIGKSTEELYPPDMYQRIRELDEACIASGKPLLGRIERFELGNGETRHVRIDSIPLRASSGEIDHMVVIATDLSEVIRAGEQIRETERRLDLAMRASGTGMWDWDVLSGRTYFNDVVFEMLGYEPGELPLTIDTWKDLCHPDDLSKASLALAEHIDGTTASYECEYRIRRKNGTYRWIRDVGRVVEKTEHGLPRRIIGVYVDIQDLQDALAKVERSNTDLQRSQQRFELAIVGSRDAIFDWDLKTNNVYFSPRWLELLKCEPLELGSSLVHLVRHVAREDAARVEQELTAFVESDTPRFESEFRLRSRDGQLVWVMMRAVSFADASGKPTRIAGSVADITSLKKAEEEMRRLVDQDHLTGLTSRARFNDRLEHAVARAGRRGDHCAVLFFDFDRFKVVNDSLGHDVGDELLCSIADRLRANLRDVDTAARFGGDEFVILLEDIATPEAARRVADKLLEICARPHSIRGHSLVSTASIGVVMSQHDIRSASDLLRFADVAMYEAKKRGRCCVVEFDQEMYAAQLQRAELEEELGIALDDGQFELHYQPVVDLESGTIVSAEALLRWNHPARGSVPPEQFVPIAEESKRIVSIGEWVIAEACRQLVDWRSRGVVGQDFTLSLNASKVQLLTPGFRRNLINSVDGHGLPRSSIKIEVTETTIVDNRSDIGEVLAALRDNAFTIMMDDFGTGHSSLSVLHNLPIDELKIDQSFIRNADTHRDLIAITSSILTLADQLSLRTIGEGIESPHHVALLQTLGCTFGQGYFWSKPVSATAFETLIGSFAKPPAASLG